MEKSPPQFLPSKVGAIFMVITFVDPAGVGWTNFEETSPARLAPHGSQARFGWPHNGEEDFISRGGRRNVEASKRHVSLENVEKTCENFCT